MAGGEYVLSLGLKVKALRVHRGWSTADLAQNSNCTLSTINRIENDKTDPQLSTLFRISTALEVPLIELLPMEAHMGQTKFSNGEKQLLQLFTDMSPTQREALLHFLSTQKEPS